MGCKTSNFPQTLPCNTKTEAKVQQTFLSSPLTQVKLLYPYFVGKMYLILPQNHPLPADITRPSELRAADRKNVHFLM